MASTGSQPEITHRPRVPLELVDHILLHLPPIVALRCAIALRRIAVRDVLMTCVPGVSLESACEKGSPSLVAWWLSRHRGAISFISSERLAFCVDTLAQYGHVEILRQWMEFGVPFEPTSAALDYAARNGHVHVFDFFSHNRLPVNVHMAEEWARERGRCDVVKWLEHKRRASTEEQ